eukprot:3691597-Amphidinium_carterae.2
MEERAVPCKNGRKCIMAGAGRQSRHSCSTPPIECTHAHCTDFTQVSSGLISILKSLNHHSPDLLFVNPFVANCR